MEYFSGLLPAIEHFHMLGYWLVFLVAFLESLVLVGIVIPGATMVIFAGALAAQGYFEPGDLIWFAAFGAILGDSLGYWLGRHGTGFFKDSNKIFKLSHLETSTRFFQKHGAKSVFLGRFVGLVRMMVPFVAGLSHMEAKRFYFWNIFSAFAWATSHVLAGYFLGQAWRIFEVWTSRVGLFLGALALVVFCAYWAKRLAFKYGKQLLELTGSVCRSFWHAFLANPHVADYLGRHPGFVRFVGHRFDRSRFSGLPLTFLSLAFVYIVFLLGGLVEDLLASDPIVAVDLHLADLFHFYRDDGLVRVFLWITLLGKAQIVLSIGLLFTYWLWARKKIEFIRPFWVTMAGSAAFGALGKLAFHRARPAFGVVTETTFSFPSGHAAIAVALYGFLIYGLCRQTQSRPLKLNCMFGGGLIIAAIGLSRLYLGVHFLSDVLGGYLLGALWLIIGICLAELRPVRNDAEAAVLSGKSKAVLALTTAIWMLFFLRTGLDYERQSPRPAGPEVARSVEADVISGFDQYKLPRSTESITGDPQEPLNFILVAGDEGSVARAFQAAGWLPADPVNFGNLVKTVNALVGHKEYPAAPITPSFWNGQINEAGFKKQVPSADSRQRYQIRIWNTDLTTPAKQRVFVGQASSSSALRWGMFHKLEPDLDAAREALCQDLIRGGQVETTSKKEFVPPGHGRNFMEDAFFTNGQVYVITFR